MYRTPQQMGLVINQPPSKEPEFPTEPPAGELPHEQPMPHQTPPAPSPMSGVPTLNPRQQKALSMTSGMGGIKETTKGVLTHPFNHLVIGGLIGARLSGKLTFRFFTIPLAVWSTASLTTTIFDILK
tara:strand:+ start:1383 stop:1763 length:381 start_codon:yes stop_codon:yes gene_type:complete